MKKSELNKTRYLLIVIGVIVAIIISLQTSAFSFQEMDEMTKVKAVTDSPKIIIDHVYDHIIKHVATHIKMN